MLQNSLLKVNIVNNFIVNVIDFVSSFLKKNVLEGTFFFKKIVKLVFTVTKLQNFPYTLGRSSTKCTLEAQKTQKMKIFLIIFSNFAGMVSGF